MSSKDLLFRVECYVGLRHALGYVVRSEEKLLKDFVRFIGAQAITGPIRAQMALDWACTFSPGRGAAGQLNRLKVVRGFLSYLQGGDSRDRGSRSWPAWQHSTPKTLSLFSAATRGAHRGGLAVEAKRVIALAYLCHDDRINR